MNVYLLTQKDNIGYDTFSEIVVIAENEADAKTISPNGEVFKPSYDWAESIEGIKCELIGTAAPDQKRGVVLYSFHAG